VSFRKIVLGTAAMSSANVLRLLAQFLVIPIISRLLSPADYGVVAIAMPFILFTMMFADAGVGRSLVRTPTGEKEIWSTCFWISAILGVILALVLIGLAPLAAQLFNEPRLSPIIMALAFVVIAQAISTIPGAALQQRHQFKIIAVMEITALVLGMITAIVVALRGGGAWALVDQQIAFYAVRVVMTFYFSPFFPLMVFDLKSVREHLIFGRDVIGVNIVGFLSRSLDNLIIGKVLGEAAVGLYSMAFQFARLPMFLVTGPLQYVLYAQLAQVKDNILAIRHIYLLLVRLLSIVVFPVMGMIAVAHHPAFTLLLSEKWSASGDLFMLAAPACALQAITGLNGTIMMVLGRTDMQFRITVEFVLLWVISLLCVVLFGLSWVVIDFNIIVLLYTPRQLMLLLPLLSCSLMTFLRILLIPTFAALVCVGMYWEIDHAMALGEWSQLIFAAILAVVGVGVSALTQRRLLVNEINLCRNAFAS